MLDKYIGQNFPDCFDNILADLGGNDLDFDDQLPFVIDGLEKEGLFPNADTFKVERGTAPE